MNILTERVRELREKTGCGIMDCKKAINESSGDFDKAIEILKAKTDRKLINISNREAKEGLIESYIHPGSKIGVMVEINCETDFVANTDEFKALAKNIAMQIAATNPIYVSESELTNTEDKDISLCLLEQDYIKDNSRTVKDIVTEAIGKLGENIIVKRFIRYELN